MWTNNDRDDLLEISTGWTEGGAFCDPTPAMEDHLREGRDEGLGEGETRAWFPFSQINSGFISQSLN